jgi:hypothetical protein
MPLNLFVVGGKLKSCFQPTLRLCVFGKRLIFSYSGRKNLLKLRLHILDPILVLDLCFVKSSRLLWVFEFQRFFQVVIIRSRDIV